jgi:hypothetical protein
VVAALKRRQVFCEIRTGYSFTIVIIQSDNVNIGSIPLSALYPGFLGSDGFCEMTTVQFTRAKPL